MKKAVKLRRGRNGEVTSLNPSNMLGVGGESTVYAFPDDESLAAKVYLNPTDEHARKLSVMCANPPDYGAPSSTDFPLAWPVDVLHSADRKRRVIGYLMPRMSGMTPIIDVYSPQSRLQYRTHFTYQDLLRTGQSLAQAVSAVHAKSYVVGDLNNTNVFVSDDARVTLIDTDSFQVPNPESGEIYLSPVFTPDFTPPEMQGEADTLVERTAEQDLFSLGVLMFLLLMAGGHPFSGSYQGDDDPPPITDRIRDGHYTFSLRRQVPYRPTAVSLPFGILAPGLQELFERCFDDGHENPAARPSAVDWQNALVEAEQNLVDCGVNQQHKYGSHLSSCPWCERTALLGGRDPFPSQEEVDAGGHIRSVEVRPTLSEDWNPEWQFQQQTREYATTGRGLTPDSKIWVGMALFLWVGIPVWSAIALAAPGVVVLAFLIYGVLAIAMPWALLASVGWRASVGFEEGSRWMVASGAGAIIGLIVIAVVSVLFAF